MQSRFYIVVQTASTQNTISIMMKMIMTVIMTHSTYVKVWVMFGHPGSPGSFDRPHFFQIHSTLHGFDDNNTNYCVEDLSANLKLKRAHIGGLSTTTPHIGSFDTTKKCHAAIIA